jgi:uncharacterized coiled-coil DUF342 family protein
MSDITQNISGDTSQLQKELAKLQKEIISLREENSKTAKSSVDDSRKQEAALKRFGESVKRDV